jgi:hypothetical protein
MTIRTYETKSGTIFEWDETPEVLEAVKQLHEQQPVSNTGPDNSVV